METRNFSSPIEADEHDGRLRITVRLAGYYNGTPATERRPMLDVVERFAPGCFGAVDIVDDDAHITADERGLKMEIDVNSSRLLSMSGRPATSSIVFRPTVVEWEAGDDGTDIRWIREAQLIEVGPSDDETDLQWLDYWRRRRAGGCEKMTQEFAAKTMSLSYQWSPASEAAIRETYNVEAR